MKVIDTHVEHLNFINKFDNEEFITINDLRGFIESRTVFDIVKSFISDDGELLGVGYIKYLWDGVAQIAFYKCGNLKAKHFREIKKAFNVYAGVFDRIQTYSVAGSFHHWHEMFGLEREAYLKKFRDGKDYELWVRIK